jgi:superfamily II DNA helicase RecQ
MLDNTPATQLRINPKDVARRADLERRKLREMIEFCYTEHCYRAHILDYFGDRHHQRKCGTCGNCTPHGSARTPLSSSEILTGPLTARQSKRRAPVTVFTARPLTDDETLRVRKILSCATRMKGRFGKHMLASTLRGSAAKNVMQAQLNNLSTYGLLKGMRQEDILLYIDSLVSARCLTVSVGEYPTVSITELGNRVMREQERITLALPPHDDLHNSWDSEEKRTVTKPMLETYELYKRGFAVGEIATHRNCTTGTIEGHLIELVLQGYAVEIKQFVSDADRVLIETAIAQQGTARLKPIHDSLPETITYNMIRFVVADRLRLQNTAQ